MEIWIASGVTLRCFLSDQWSGDCQMIFKSSIYLKGFRFLKHAFNEGVVMTICILSLYFYQKWLFSNYSNQKRSQPSLKNGMSQAIILTFYFQPTEITTFNWMNVSVGGTSLAGEYLGRRCWLPSSAMGLWVGESPGEIFFGGTRFDVKLGIPLKLKNGSISLFSWFVWFVLFAELFLLFS